MATLSITKPRPLRSTVADVNWTTKLDARRLQDALRAAASATSCIVGDCIAAPLPKSDGLELAIEFIVPPADAGHFTAALDAQLAECVPAYTSARRDGLISPPLLRTVPAGTFHQWRLTYRMSRPRELDCWSTRRAPLEAILHQARTGWREIIT